MSFYKVQFYFKRNFGFLPEKKTQNNMEDKTVYNVTASTSLRGIAKYFLPPICISSVHMLLIHMCIYIHRVKEHPCMGGEYTFKRKCMNSFKPPGLLDPPPLPFFFFKKEHLKTILCFHKLLTSVLISVPLTSELC